MKYSKIIEELCKDLGMTFEDGELSITIGNRDKQNIRSDINKIGGDMRRVIARM
jgi:hypothetical protein